LQFGVAELLQPFFKGIDFAYYFFQLLDFTLVFASENLGQEGHK
jgi:hypothetical protein